MTVDDEWVDVTVPDGALIVNLGDLLQRWTNDRYRSTRHRVIPPTERDRYSVPVFVNPEWSTPRCAACRPARATERPARYAPVLSGEYLQSRYDDTFVYRRRRPVTLDSRNASSRRNGAFMRTELHVAHDHTAPTTPADRFAGVRARRCSSSPRALAAAVGWRHRARARAPPRPTARPPPHRGDGDAHARATSATGRS